MRQDRAPSLLLVLWIVSALLAGCDTDGSPPPPTEAAAFPWPELDGVEADVREHLIETRATLESALSAEADSLSLGQAFGEAGIVYHGYALRMAARSAYSRAEALDPRSARWPYLRGHTLRVGEDVQGAVEAFRSALDRDGGLVAAWIALGEVLFDLDRTEEAEAAFLRARELSPGTAAAHAGLGRVRLERRDHAAAARSLEEALRLAPQASAYRYPLGLAYRGLGDDERAIAEMEQRGMLAAPPEDPHLQRVREAPAGWRVHLRRGTSLFTEGRFDFALEEFEQAVISAPDVATVRLNLGTALVRVGRAGEALPHFEAAAQLDPGAALPWFNLGVLAGRAGQDLRAVEYYRRAVECDPGLHDADFNRGNALRRLGRFREAAEAYEGVVRQAPQRTEARLGQALALAREGEDPAARRVLEAALALDAEDPGVRNALARLLCTGASPVDAPRAFELARSLVEEESSLEHVETCAMAYAALGQRELAVELQEKALAAARGAGLDLEVRVLEENLARYARGETAERGWTVESPVLSPPSLRSHSPAPAEAAGDGE